MVQRNSLPNTVPTKKGNFGPSLLWKNLGVCRLGVAKIHNFVQKLIYNNKVILNALLADLLEVVLKQLETSDRKEQGGGTYIDQLV